MLFRETNMAAGDDSEIPDSGAVFTFGKSKFADNVPNKFWVRNDKVLSIACGDEHTALVAESGRLFTFGSNDWGQLGLETTKPATKPSCVKRLKSEKVELVACGRVHTIVSTESGKLFSFGANGEGQLGVEDVPSSNEPREVEGIKGNKFTQLAAGADHSVALTDDGEVYVWGGGSEGQLGLGDETECPKPQVLDTEDNVICISCGYYHTAIVTDQGDVFTFGESDGGKLGLGDESIKAAKPTKINIPEKCRRVACGGSHTVVLTESGKVYTFGDGSNGQLGHGNKVLQSDTPVLLNISYKVSDIACGENHTALISEKGQLYTFGDGRHGKLALGQESYSNQLAPLKVNKFTRFTVEKVSCGGCHMIVTAHLRMQNGDINSTDEELEEENEHMNKTSLNQSIRPDGSIDLGGSVGARNRRRQESMKRTPSLNRTLPSLAHNTKTVESLSATHPPDTKKKSPTIPAQQIPPVKSKQQDSEESSEESEEEETQKLVPNHVSKTEAIKSNTKVSPRPRPLPRRQTQEIELQKVETETCTEGDASLDVKPNDKADNEESKRSKQNGEEESKSYNKTDDEESENEEEKKETVNEIPNKKEDESRSEATIEDKVKKKEESDEEDESEEEDVKVDKPTPAVRALPSGPVPKPRAQPKVPAPAEDSDEEEEKIKEQEKQKNKKKKGLNVFGKTSTGLSDDEEDEEEEEEDDDEKEEDKEEVKEEEKEEEKEEKGDKKKDKKKDKKDKKKEKKEKKDKKDKKDKKKEKKKGKKEKDEDEKEEEDEEQEEEEEEEEEDKKKNKKKDKKDKEKKKDKKEKEKKGKEKNKKKDKKKEDEDDENEDKTEEKEVEDDTDKDDKEDSKKEEKDDKKEEKDDKKEDKPAPKKSRTCIIL